MIELLKEIFHSSGITGLLIFLSLVTNGILTWYLIKIKDINSEKEKLTNPDKEMETVLVSNFTEQIEKIENLLIAVKKEMELFTFSEHQPIREMLLKITASIELLAKTIEFAVKTNNSDRDK